ncbi:MAG: preprotein translocase subunit SecG [Desulfobacterales bacterium]
MSALLITVHIIVCIALIMIVLLQTGKGADMGAAFGGGGSQTLFGSTGASSFLSKATTWVAVIFMLTCLSLAYVSSHRSGSSIMKDVEIPAAEPEAAAPAEETAEKTETEASAPLQTSAETQAATPEGEAADTKEVPAQSSSVSESAEEVALPSAETSGTDSDAVQSPVSAEGSAQEGKSE